jgi:hypothetical protein
MSLENFPKPKTEKSEESSKIEKPGYIPELSPEEIKKNLEKQKQRDLINSMLGKKTEEGQRQSENFYKETQVYGKLVIEAKKIGIELPLKSDIVPEFQKGLDARNSNTELVHVMIGSTPGTNVERIQGTSVDAGVELRTYIRKKLSALPADEKEKLKNIPEASLYL